MSATTTSETHREEFGFDMTDAQYATVNVLSRVAGSMVIEGTGDVENTIRRTQAHEPPASAGYFEPGPYLTTFEKNGSWVIVRTGGRAVPSIVRSDGTVF